MGTRMNRMNGDRDEIRCAWRGRSEEKPQAHGIGLGGQKANLSSRQRRRFCGRCPAWVSVVTH